MGLETVTITGRAKGIDYGIEETSDSNHAWNATKINGIWYLIDTTWGAGILDGDVFRPEFNPFYFAPEPAHIIYSHFPEIPEWQLLPQKITREAFEKFPLLKPHFFDQKLELVEPKDYTISLKHFDEITLRAPLEVDVVATYQPIHQSSNQQKDLKVLRSQRDVKIPLIDMGTDYQVNIFSQYKSQYKDIQQPYELAAIFQVRSQ
jgi:transglutaminase/protease-like cytokinesis protein 3